MKIVTIIATVVIAALISVITVMVRRYRAKKRSQAHQELLEELGQLSWENPKDALKRLEDLKGHVDETERHKHARHYLTVCCMDLIGNQLLRLEDALRAKEYFADEIREIARLSRLFACKHGDISPFSEEEMLQSYLKTQVKLLEHWLEHFPEIAPAEISPGKILSALTDCAEPNYTRDNLEKWRAWIRVVYLRQAKREVRLIRRRHYFLADENNAAVDHVFTLLTNAKARPEDIDTTTDAINSLRQIARQG